MTIKKLKGIAELSLYINLNYIGTPYKNYFYDSPRSTKTYYEHLKRISISLVYKAMTFLKAFHIVCLLLFPTARVEKSLISVLIIHNSIAMLLVNILSDFSIALLQLSRIFLDRTGLWFPL